MSYIRSATELEVLLFVRARPLAEWDAKAVAAMLRLEPAEVKGALAHLEAVGLLASRREPSLLYQFHPRSEALASMTQRLAATFETRRLAVLALVLANEGTHSLRLFADAFRLRTAPGEAETDERGDAGGPDSRDRQDTQERER